MSYLDLQCLHILLLVGWLVDISSANFDAPLLIVVFCTSRVNLRGWYRFSNPKNKMKRKFNC